MLNRQTEKSANAGTGTNTHWQVMIAWTETSDVEFCGIIEICKARSA